MFKKMKQNEKGFTLVELVVVIAILAVLCTLFVPQILKNTKDARETTTLANARTLASEITIWNAQCTDDKQLIGHNGTSFNAGQVTQDTDNIKNVWTVNDGAFPKDDSKFTIQLDSNGNARVSIKST